MTSTAHPARQPLHYAWIVVAVTFLTLLAAAGGRAAPGVMILPVCNEFEWSRATVSSIIAINIFLYGLVGPFAAALYQSLGLRRTMLLAMSLIAAGYGWSTLATHYWQFVVLWGFVVGAGSGMAATVLGAAVATRWFSQRRGLVTGVLTASTATGQLVFLPSLAQIVTTHGWRGAPWVVCAGAVAAHQLGAAFAAFGAGWLRMSTGAYTAAFTAAGALCLVAAIGVLPVGRADRKRRLAAVA